VPLDCLESPVFVEIRENLGYLEFRAFPGEMEAKDFLVVEEERVKEETLGLLE